MVRAKDQSWAKDFIEKVILGWSKAAENKLSYLHLQSGLVWEYVACYHIRLA